MSLIDLEGNPVPDDNCPIHPLQEEPCAECGPMVFVDGVLR